MSILKKTESHSLTLTYSRYPSAEKVLRINHFNFFIFKYLHEPVHRSHNFDIFYKNISKYFFETLIFSETFWGGRNTCMWICTLWIYSLSTLENSDKNKMFFVHSPQALWLSSAPGVLSTVVTSVVPYSLPRATLMSPGQNETCECR